MVYNGVGRIQLSKNFYLDEFMCSSRSNKIMLPDYRLVSNLQNLRDIVGSITITSGYRDEEFNASVGGVKGSYHTKGLAVDCRFDFTDWNKGSLIKLFVAMGFTNIGFYWLNNKLNRVHLDIGDTWNKKEYYVYDKKA